MTYSARYRVEVDWADIADSPYSHAASDVTYLINSYKSTHGNTVYLEDREGRLDVGEGSMQLRYDENVFGPHGSVSIDQLSSIHKIRLTELTTQVQCWEGLVELDNEFDAHFTNGDVLGFTLHGKGYLKDGGSWTYPRGSAFGGSVNDGLQVVVSEDAIDPTAFTSAGTIDSAIPTRMVPTTDGKLIGQDGSGNVIELDGTTRRSYSPIAQGGTDTVSGRDGNLQINVTRTYRNYEESRIGEDAFGTETALSGTLPTKMQTMGDGRAIGRLSTGAVVELEGGTRRQYAAIGVDSPASTVAGSVGNTDITVNKRVRNYTQSPIDTDDFSGSSSVSGSLPTKMQTMSDGSAIGRLSNGALVELDGTTRRQYPAIGVNSSRTETGQAGNVSITVNKRTRNYENQDRMFLIEDASSSTKYLRSFLLNGTRFSDDDIALPGTGSSPEVNGVAVNGNRIYVSLGYGNGVAVLVYDFSGTRHTSEEPSSRFDEVDGRRVGGIAVTDTRIYTMDEGFDFIRSYTHAGAHQESEDIRLPRVDWQGLTIDNDYFYALDNTAAHLYRFDRNALPIRLASSDTSPTGVSVTATRVYTVDTSGDEVHVYNHAGVEQSSESFDLGTGNNLPYGIAVTSNRVFVLDRSDSQVYAYTHSGTRMTSDDIDLSSHSTGNWEGIQATSTRLYVTALEASALLGTRMNIFAYDHSGNRQSDDDLATGRELPFSSNNYGDGVAITGDRIYMLANDINQIWSYDLDGTRQNNEDIVIPQATWTNIAEYDGTLYVTDNVQEIVFTIPLDAKPIALTATLRGAYKGVTVTDDRIYVLNQQQQRGAVFTRSRITAFDHDGNHVQSSDIDTSAYTGIVGGIAVINRDAATLSTTNTDEANYSVPATVDRLTETTTYNGPILADASNIYRVRRVQGRDYDSWSSGATNPVAGSSSDWTDSKTFDSAVHSVDITYSWSSGSRDTRTWNNWDYFGHSWSRNADGSLNISNTGSGGGSAPTLVRSGTLTYLQAANGLYVIKNGTLYELGNVASGTGTSTSRGALPANSNASVAGGRIGTKDYLLTDDNSGIREITDASTATLGTAESFPDAVRPTAWSVSGGTVYMYRLSDGDYWTADFGRSLLHTNTTTESNYSVPATVGNVTTTVTFSGPLFDFSNTLWRARRAQERTFDTYSGGTNGPTESTSSSDWDQTNTGVAYNSSLHYIDVTYSWSTGNKTTQNTDVWDAAGYSYSRNADGSLAINSSVFSGGTIPTIMRSGTRTYYTSGSGLYLIASGNLYLITGMNTNTVTATSQGTLPAAVNDARAAAEVGQYRYLISDNGAAWYNNDDLDNSPVLIGNFASGIRPHAIGYDSGNIHIYDLTGSKYWVASRGRTLLGSQTATVARNVPATIGNQTIRTNFAGSLFEYQNKLWKARRIRTRTYNSWIAGNTIEENGGSWFQAVTEDPNIHSKTTQFSWTAGNSTTSNTDVWDYAGYTATRSSSGSLSIGSSTSTGGGVPTVLRSGTPLYFPAAGGLYVVRSGVLYQITGFPGTANLATLGTLANAYNNPRGALHVGDRTYLVSDNGEDIYQLDNLEGISTSDLGSFPSSLALNFLTYTAEVIYAYEQSGTRRVYQVDRFTRTARRPDSDDPEDEIQPLVDTLDVEYFDESKYGEPAFEYVKALAEELGVTFNESKSTAVPDTVSGLVRYGPQWDIALADAAYTGWTGQYMFALKDGSIAVAFPGDVRKGSRSLTFNNYFVVGPLEVKRNRTMVTNASRAQGIEQL